MNRITIDGNSAMAHIAYLMNELAVIYPIVLYHINILRKEKNYEIN